MSSVDQFRTALKQAEERHADAVRRATALNHEMERLWAEVVTARDVYARAVDREIALGPAKSRKTDADAGEQWDDPGPDFDRLVLQAGSGNAGDRVVAQRAIERMGPKAIDPLLKMIARETLRWERRINVVCGVLVALIVAAMLQLPLLIGFPFGYALMLLSLPLLIWYAKPFGPHKKAAEALARIDDVRVIAPLVEALDMEDPVIVGSAVMALKRLMQRLRPTDNSALAESHWQTLFRVVDKYHDGELALAAIQGLEQAGDERALPFVAPLAEGKGVAARRPEVVAAARECVEMLADQSLRGRPGKTLLRAIHDPNGSDEALLRPAAANSASDESVLLRVNTADDPVEDI